MAGNNKQKNRRRRPRGPTKVDLWKDLAVIGIVPDQDLSKAQLKRIRDLAYMFLPGGQIGDGRPNTYVEIFGSMLKSHGFMGNDAKEAIGLIWGTGAAIHYIQIPDFDPSAENKAEKGEAKAVGKDFLKVYNAVAKARKITKKEAKEIDKAADWRTSM